MSDTTSTTSRSSVGSFATRLNNAYAEGYVKCRNHMHFHRGRDANGAFRYIRNSNDEIISGMLPLATAQCDCERRACEAKWDDTRDGQLTSRYVCKGTYTVGIKGYTEGGNVREILHLNYRLTPDQFKTLSEENPGLYFVTGDRDHDHPVAHTRTVISSRNLIKGLRRGTAETPRTYLDLFGNPAANAGYNGRTPHTRLETCVELCTPKDYIRAAEKWGDDWEERDDVHRGTMRDMSLYISEEWEGRLKRYDGYVSMHTLYYMQRNEIASLLAQSKKGAMLKAIVHRFPDSHGKLNGGEQKYVKRVVQGQYYVKQTNVKTGESYDHPDVEWLFKNDSYIDEHTNNAMGWTLNLMAPDVYEVKIVSVPASQARMSTALMGEELVVAMSDAATLQIKNEVELTVGTEKVTLHNVGAESFSDARLLISGKARTADQYRDHLAAVKRMMKKHNEVKSDAHATALASFMVDFDQDFMLTRAVIGRNIESAETLARVLKGEQPLAVHNIIDKMLAFGALAAANRNKDTGHQISGILRLSREMVQSRGHKVT